MYSCYKINDVALKQLLIHSFPTFIGDQYTVHCDHITHQFPSDSLPPPLESVEMTGIVYEKNKVAGVLVRVNGSDFRPDGKRYHITVFTAEGVPPVYTNSAIHHGKIKMNNKDISLDTSQFVGVIQP